MTVHRPVIVGDRACPNCGASAGGRVAMRADGPAELLSQDQLQVRWRVFFAPPCFFTYNRCSSCGQLFCTNYFSDTTLADLYSAMNDNIHSGDSVSSEQAQADYSDLIMQIARKTDRYLEIGPDVGLLARAIQKRAPVRNAFLVEPNRAVWGQLAEVFPPGVANLAVDFREFEEKIPDGSLDLVVGVHVLDHLLRPREMLQWISRKLAPTGVVAIVVHNESSLLAKALGRKWPAYCLQHPQLFNPATLASILGREGLETKIVLPTPNRFPLGYLVSHAVFAALRLKLKLAFLRWPVRVRLGNIMGIATKRGRTKELDGKS